MQNLQSALLIAAWNMDIVLVLQLFKIPLHRVKRSKAEVLFDLLKCGRHRLVLHKAFDELEHFEFFEC